MIRVIDQGLRSVFIALACLPMHPTQVRSETEELRIKIEALGVATGQLEATKFSPTSVLTGQTSLVMGGNQFGGSAQGLKRKNGGKYGATTVNYDARIILDTSFNGQDLLHLRLRAGNFDGATNSFAGAGPSLLSQLEVAFQAPLAPNRIAVNRLYYQWPIGEFTFTLGPRVEQDTMLAIWPSVYPSESILDLTTYSGAIGASNLSTGSGVGVWWKRSGFAISANYVAANGNLGGLKSGGIAGKASGSSTSIQVGYAGKSWALTALYSAVQNGFNVIPYGTNFTLNSLLRPGTTNAFGLSGYWQPSQKSWLPSISAGWGVNNTSYSSNINDTGLVDTSQSWVVGLEWQDAFRQGNSLGMAVGQPTFATSLKGGGTPNDGNLIWEWWYKVALSDQIALTPGVFYLSRPLGADTPTGKSFSQLGALVKTSFRF